MRKYEILRHIYESNAGATPKELSLKLGTAIPNIYTYLKGLTAERLVQKSKEKYIANKTNRKLKQLLDLQAIAPEYFNLLITDTFKSTLSKLCANVKKGRSAFKPGELAIINKIAVPKRIVLRLSRRPSVFCLKINEALVGSLLSYHDLSPEFSVEDFQKAVAQTEPGEIRSTTKQAESDPRIIKMCDEQYATGQDLSIITKAAESKLEPRIIETIKSVDNTNKEYQLFLSALEENVRNTIQNQWKSRYIYNTNSIEGNTMSEKDVNEYLKKGFTPQNISKRELYETANTSNALDYLRLKRKEAISEDFISELHFMIQKDIADNPGEYKNFYNFVKPLSPTTPPQYVRERMKALIEWHNKNKDTMHPILLASIFHMQFELIHPFADGNGRVGRLLLNHILEQNGYMPITIFEKTKQTYYRSLENRSLPQFLDHILASFIEEYKR